MKGFVILFAVALFATNSAFARLNTIEMTKHEQMFNSCGTFQKYAELADIRTSSLLVDMLKIASRRGATDIQLAILKTEFELGQEDADIRMNDNDKKEFKRRNGDTIKEYIGYCQKLIGKDV